MSPANNIEIKRDEQNDILYVMRADADPDQTVNFDMHEDVVLRVDSKTKQVVGFIIDDFPVCFEIWKDLPDYKLMEKFESLIEGLNNLHLAPSNH